MHPYLWSPNDMEVIIAGSINDASHHFRASSGEVSNNLLQLEVDQICQCSP